VTVAEVAQLLLAVGATSGFVGAVVAAYQSRAARRRLDVESEKFEAEIDKALTDRASTVNSMALSLLEPMQRRIEALTNEVHHLESEVFALTDRLRLAHRLLTDHGIALPPHPER